MRPIPASDNPATVDLPGATKNLPAAVSIEIAETIVTYGEMLELG